MHASTDSILTSCNAGGGRNSSRCVRGLGSSQATQSYLASVDLSTVPIVEAGPLIDCALTTFMNPAMKLSCKARVQWSGGLCVSRLPCSAHRGSVNGLVHGEIC